MQVFLGVETVRKKEEQKGEHRKKGFQLALEPSF
jgi:hypothetical protein